MYFYLSAIIRLYIKSWRVLMKNKSKLLTGFAAASMVITQAGQLNVFAKGAAMDSTDNHLVSENTNAKKTKKELLEEQLLDASKKAEAAKMVESDARSKYENYKTSTYDVLNANQLSKKNDYDLVSLTTQNEILKALEQQISDLEQNQKELTLANDKKKEFSSKLDDASKKLLEAQSSLDKAQKEYDALLNGSNEEALSKDVEAKKLALEKAQKDLADAKKTVDDLNAQKASVVSSIVDATKSYENAKAAYEKAQSVTLQAQKDLDSATSNYNEKKAIYDSASDPAIKAQYEADIKNAENELVTAQTNLQVALENQTAKANAVTSAEKSLSDVNQEILNLDGQITEKQKALDVLNQTINDAETALNEAKAQLETAKANQEAKEKELETAKTNLEKAKQDVATQQSKVNEAQDAVIAQEKVVTQLRTDKEQAQAKIEQGSKGFFEAYGYTDALKILEEQSTANGGSTNIGAENDATSLENFKRALSMVRYGNNLRTTDTNFTGREELKVNPTLFAISQVQINATANGKTFDHSGLYNVGENIAASQRPKDDKGLYTNWYDSEKQVYDYITAKGWTIADVRNDETKLNEVMEAVGHSNIQIGHYLNLTGLNSDATGTAYIYSKTPAPDGYRCNAGQVFAYVSRSSYITEVNTMTIDEFEAQFNEYYNKLMNADSILKDGESKLEALKAELENQRQVLGTKTAAQTNAQTNVETVQTQVTQAENATARAKANVATKQAAFDKLCDDDTAFNMANEIVGLKTQKAQLETVDRVNAQKALENAQQEKKGADQNVENKKGIVNDAQATLKKRKDVLDEANKGVELAQSNLEVAKKNLDEKTNVLTSAKSDESSKKGLYDSSKSSLVRLNVKLSELNKDLEAAKNSVSTKENALSNAQKAYDSAIQKQSSVNTLKQDIVSKKSVIDSYQKDIQLFKEAVSKLDVSIKQLKNEEVTIETRIVEIQKVMDAYDKLCANPNGVVDVGSSDDVIINGLYVKLNSMKEAYNAYLKAVDEFNKADAINNQNKKELDVATENYDKAKAELKKAQDELDAYLKVTGTPGWHKLDNDWYFVDSNGNFVTNKWQGNYYLESDGKMATNKWIDNFYVGSDGLWIENKWIQSGNQWWYRHGDGTCTTNDFETISGQTYYFDGNGYMVTGWQKINGQDYYFNASGIMAMNTWVGAYYLGEDGTMLTNQFTVDGYYVGASGAYLTNTWFKHDGKDYYVNGAGKVVKNAWQGAYYLGEDGAMLKNQFTPDGYYVGETGAYLTNQKINVSGKDYYLNAYGTLAKNQWAGDYYVDSNNNPFKETWAGSYYLGSDGKYVKNQFTPDGYYCGADGIYVTNRWIKVDGKDYFMNASGKMAKDTWQGSYYLGSDGAMVTSSWVDNNQYYVNENGLYVAGKWVQYGSRWCYYAGNVYAKDITLNIGGIAYTFDSEGYMVE